MLEAPDLAELGVPSGLQRKKVLAAIEQLSASSTDSVSLRSHTDSATPSDELNEPDGSHQALSHQALTQMAGHLQSKVVAEVHASKVQHPSTEAAPNPVAKSNESRVNSDRPVNPGLLAKARELKSIRNTSLAELAQPSPTRPVHPQYNPSALPVQYRQCRTPHPPYR